MRKLLPLTIALAIAGCGDEPLTAGPDVGAQDAVVDVQVDVRIDPPDGAEADVPEDAAPSPDDAADGTADLLAEPEVADAAAPTPDTAEDAATDGQAGDSTPDTAPDVPPACPGCLWTQPPPAPHPGGPGKYGLAPSETFQYSGTTGGKRDVLVYKPTAAGSFPVLVLVPGKGLTSGGGIPAKLGHPYSKLLEHVASHGYVAALVEVEQNALDSDHLRMADDLLAALKALPSEITTADTSQVVFAGHSMGAKVAMLAAWRTLNDDKAKEHPDPAAVLAFGLVNDKSLLGNWVDTVEKAKVIVPSAPTRFTFVQAHDDATAPYLDAKKPNAQAVYAALQTKWKQVIVLHGTGKGDPNPLTQPELHDDHAAPLTVEGKVGSLADLGLPDSHLDALDWYGYWKITVGTLDHAFRQGDPTWAYGAMRTHGGNLPDGKSIQHEVFAQNY